jgi:hypothetical protein
MKDPDTDLHQRGSADHHTNQDIKDSDGGTAISDHHQEPSVIPVRQDSGRHGKQQRRQETQEGDQCHAGSASRLPEYIDPEAETCQAAADGGNQFT